MPKVLSKKLGQVNLAKPFSGGSMKLVSIITRGQLTQDKVYTVFPIADGLVMVYDDSKRWNRCKLSKFKPIDDEDNLYDKPEFLTTEIFSAFPQPKAEYTPV